MTISVVVAEEHFELHLLLQVDESMQAEHYPLFKGEDGVFDLYVNLEVIIQCKYDVSAQCKSLIRKDRCNIFEQGREIEVSLGRHGEIAPAPQR